MALTKNKKKVSIFFTIIFLALFVFSAGVLAPIDASNANTPIKSLDETAQTGYGQQQFEQMKDASVAGIVGKFIGALLAFIGILYFLLMIYGGFTWMTARGNEEQVKQAIGLITHASIGIAIVASAYLITRFVGESIFNSVRGNAGGATQTQLPTP